MGEGGRRDGAVLLQQTLTQAIASLQPDAERSDRLPLLRAYEILHYRYVQQCSQQEVADQLGVTVRHLKREQKRALEILASRLGERYGLYVELGTEPEDDAEPQSEQELPTTGGDLRWLKELLPSQPSKLSDVAPSVVRLVGLLARQHEVELRVEDMVGVPDVAARSVAVRQMLLGLLTVGIRHVTGGTLTMSASSASWQVAVQVEGFSGRRAMAQSPDDSDSLNMVRQMADACAGNLDAALSDGSFRATLNLPAAAQVPVLVIDDNPEILDLLQRYATGTRYRVITEQNPGSISAVVGDVLPRVIMLDVMMPEVDGWELLGRLRQHPLTSHVPIVVCTILAQEELAMSLGVSAFLRKPVQRRDFLQILDRLVALDVTPR